MRAPSTPQQIAKRAGVILASVYMLRAYIRTMHGPAGGGVESREIAPADALVVVPLVAAIVALAFYPQLPLARSQAAVTGAVRTAQLIAAPPRSAGADATRPQGRPPPGGPIMPGRPPPHRVSAPVCPPASGRPPPRRR